MQSRSGRMLFAVGLAASSFGLGAFSWSARSDAAETAPEAPAAATTAAANAEAPSPIGRGAPSFASIARAVSPAVVHVKVVSVVNASGAGQMPFPFPFGGNGPHGGAPMPRRQQGSGSGFVISKDGVVVTNNHVVENAKEITVKLTDGTEYAARVLGRDPKTDLAVLKVDAKGELAVAKLGDSDALEVGEWAVAIGNPFGLENSVTAGIVSAKGRAIGNSPYDQFIQTDAPINPGNSGGPLCNERGEVVGINTAIFSQGGGSIGIGFAIPINVAKQLVPQLEADGRVTRGWLGVSIQALTPDIAESLDLTGSHGALVAGVESGSPAAKAGLESGDLITRFGGQSVKDHAALPALVAATPIGDVVPVEIVRDGKSRTLEVEIARLADDELAQGESPAKGRFGLALRDLRPEERLERGIDEGEGVLVTGVEPGSPAEEAGLEAGDVVLRVNRKAVASVNALRQEAGKVDEGDKLVLLIRPRDGSDRFAALAAR